MFDAFADSFLRIALVASLIVGAVCGYLGVFVVLRRVVFVGAALAQISSAGFALAMITGTSPTSVSMAATLGGVAAFSVRSRERRTTQESLIGVGYAVASALALLFASKSAQGETHLLDVLSGNILTVTPAEVWLMGVASVIAVTVHLAFSKQFVYSMFDPLTADACGMHSAWWDLLFFLVLAVIISLAIKLAGTLLVLGFLVVPAVTGLLLSQRIATVCVLAVASSALATITGLYASVRWDLPSGPAIVAALFAGLLLAWLARLFS